MKKIKHNKSSFYKINNYSNNNNHLNMPNNFNNINNPIKIVL